MTASAPPASARAWKNCGGNIFPQLTRAYGTSCAKANQVEARYSKGCGPLRDPQAPIDASCPRKVMRFTCHASETAYEKVHCSRLHGRVRVEFQLAE